MFGLFKKEKKEEPQITVDSPDMGRLTWDEWMWYGKCTVFIFGEPTEIDVHVYPYDEVVDEPITVQEERFRYYREHENEFNDIIEKALFDEYELEDVSLVRSRFKPILLLLHRNGDGGLAFRDFEKSKGSSEAEVVVAIFPEVEFAGSIEVYD